MNTTLTENQKRTKPTRALNSDQRFVKGIWARILSGEDMRVWLAGFNYKAHAVCHRRGDLRVLTCAGWKLCTQMSFSDVRLTKEHWQDEHTV